MQFTQVSERTRMLTSGNLNPAITRLGLKALVSHILQNMELKIGALNSGYAYPTLFLNASLLRSKHGPVGNTLHISVSLDDDEVFHVHLRGLELLGEKEDSLDIAIPMGSPALSSEKLKALAKPVPMEYLRIFSEHDDYRYCWQGLPYFTEDRAMVIHPTIPTIKFHQRKLGDEFSLASHIVDLRTRFAWCLLTYAAHTLPETGELLLTMGKDKIVEFDITPKVRVGIWVIRENCVPVRLQVVIPEGKGTHTFELPIESDYDHREVWCNVRNLIGECDLVHRERRVEMLNKLHLLQGFDTTDMGTFSKGGSELNAPNRIFTFNKDLGDFLGLKQIGFNLL